MFDTNEKERQYIQGQVKTISKQIPNFESNHMKMEVKEEVKTENFEDFEAHEQVRIGYVTSKDLNDPSIKSETFGMKTEFKAKVKEEAFEEFDGLEQFGMNFICNKDFDKLLNKENVYGKPSFVLKPSNTELSAISHYFVTCWRYPPSPTLQARPGGSTTA